jgi:PhnB protein
MLASQVSLRIALRESGSPSSSSQRRAVSAETASASAAEMKRLAPPAINGATSRTLLVVDDPDAVLQRAVEAGASEISPAADEHGWRIGRITDPFGHEWEIGKPLGAWPPT